MEGLELLSFNIISNIGTAKSMIMESLQKSRTGQFEEAQQLIEAANEYLTKGEKEHFKVITQEAREKNIQFTILFMHAEDQLMSTVTLIDIAKELLEINQDVYYLKKQMTVQ
ncbi:PTS lactose/cellobiose transporter subunit IIA [Melissococcus plutonius]|uniref:PTS system, cellobiose-specific IIA component n=1 Tax=Melissococcus plutonius (strain ATCC 35311 / DSM 29964 / CIP 104052 / LMG 20360 / NCIMB 702443) TaxID=940190 RepID=F3YB60_MELPT|nr:PTS lactose/cellobiose transporter subunit IIA [Melissococcus plutonius]AIM25841.1 PTS system, cellobiose-specific IIA component [Melissococcus plutonius S1]KMT25418.1 PTS system, cellobiose-specific IIA component [Melissococcus plutonius]KMT25458.1 PTS system, cellobiose-specific IIA component [Melissococcus plutonius]KMT26322.1 PTS system, cellobiose-specific IIA component [Melissococcus plutonius]KMT29064.1 PTS system, cellobiose-specific IIA component [Melissococcus plutonius]